MRLRRSVLVLALMGACGALSPGAPAQRRERAYCNLTAIESERLPNAVKIVLRSDGLMAPDIQSRDLFNVDAARMGRWDRMGKRITVIPIRIMNARSQVGSIVNVGVYPVSHVEISVPQEAAEGIGVDVRIVLFQPAMTREVRLTNDRWNYSPANEPPPFISIEQSQDRRSILVIVTSDRRTPERPVRREPAPPDRAEVYAAFLNGNLSLYAVDAPLQEVLAAIGKAAGRTILAAPGVERAVTACLDGVPLADALDALSTTYGLSLRETATATYAFDAAVQEPAASRETAFEEIPVHYLTAIAARNCLPDFLLEHVRVDEGRNSLTVSGSPQLVRKVREDIRRLDQPVPMVRVQVLAVEWQRGEDLLSMLNLSGRWRGGALSLGDGGDVTYDVVPVEPGDLQVRLTQLFTNRRVRLRGETSATVLAGRSARLAVGSQKRMATQYFDFWQDRLETRIITVQYGTTVAVTPIIVTPDSVTLSVRCEVSDIVETDRATGNPTLAQQLSETTIRVGPGDTLYIGGLSLSDSTTRRRSWPLGLGSRLSSEARAVQELGVFVTATVVAGSAAAAAGTESGDL